MSDGHEQATTRDARTTEAEFTRLRIENPGSIRALAHPARLAIIDALTGGEELTATECAELAQLSPSATAYHLKFLERYGMVEPAPPRSDRRQRPWRATGRPTEVALDPTTPAGGSAAAAVMAALIDATRAIAVDFAEHEHAEPEEWRHAALNNVDLWLTAEEFQQVVHELEAALEPYRRRGRGAAPPGSRHVKAMSVVVPHRAARPRR